MTPPAPMTVEGFLKEYVNKTLTPLGISYAKNSLKAMLYKAREEQLEAVAQFFEIEESKRISGKRIAWIVRGAKNLCYTRCNPLQKH